MAGSGNARALLYGLMNVISASGIVFANKHVLSSEHTGWGFTYALTLVHTLFTLVGMYLFSRAGMFKPRPFPTLTVAPLACAYVGYICLGTLSLNLNTVGFYQVMKIAVAPTIIALELLMFKKLPSRRIILSVLVVCMGILVATVSDSKVASNVFGILVGVGATITTAVYQIWAGSKQRELSASSFQLLHAYTPLSAVMLGLLVPMLEPMGWRHQEPGTLLGFRYTPMAVTAILISSVLGLLVSLSTFLFIGATSSLTYNVVGHVKTIIILTGGCLFFGDAMPLKKLVGVGLAMLGVVWYTHEVSQQPKDTQGAKLRQPRNSPLLGDVEGLPYASYPKSVDSEGWVLVKGRNTRSPRTAQQQQ